MQTTNSKTYTSVYYKYQLGNNPMEQLTTTLNCAVKGRSGSTYANTLPHWEVRIGTCATICYAKPRNCICKRIVSHRTNTHAFVAVRLTIIPTRAHSHTKIGSVVCENSGSSRRTLAGVADHVVAIVVLSAFWCALASRWICETFQAIGGVLSEVGSCVNWRALSIIERTRNWKTWSSYLVVGRGIFITGLKILA